MDNVGNRVFSGNESREPFFLGVFNRGFYILVARHGFVFEADTGHFKELELAVGLQRRGDLPEDVPANHRLRFHTRNTEKHVLAGAAVRHRVRSEIR